MFEDRDLPPEDLAERIYKLISCFKEREGALEALAAYGIMLQEGEDSAEE